MISETFHRALLKTALSAVSYGRTLRALKTPEQAQWLDRETTDQLQAEQLSDFLLYAYEHVPYYRRILKEAGVIASNREVKLEKFSDIPLLNKATIRERFEDLRSDELAHRKWYYNTSGGSTGEPVRLVQDKHYLDWGRAVKMMFDQWSGYSIGSRKVLLWGSERDLFVGQETFKTKVSRWLKNEVWLNAFRMTPRQMRVFVDRINTFRPLQILAYAESIYQFSRFIEGENLKVYSPKAIMSEAGTMFPHMRETIERVFKAPVFNCYGSREVGDIACECDQHMGLHISVPTHYVEVLRKDGSPAEPGELGEVVVTSLTNYAMPLIRYRIGDMAIWADEPCSCGRSWPLLAEVTGRVTDAFAKRDGGVVVPEYFIHLIGVVLNTGWIHKYQIIQEDYDSVRVLLVPQESAEDLQERHSEEISEIAEKIRLVMGEACQVNFEFVEDILPTASGKYRYTISKVTNRTREDQNVK